MRPSLVKGFIITTFVSLYLVVSVISTIHVIDFFRLSNPNWLAVSLAIAFEIGAAASLASLIALDKMNKTLIWFLFIVLTGMQMMGNTYYAFTNLHDFQSWVELFGLVDEELIYQKRILSIISGAILPLVALGFIKSLVDYIRPSEEDDTKDIVKEDLSTKEEIAEAEAEATKNLIKYKHKTIDQDKKEALVKQKPQEPAIDVSKVWDQVEKLREEGKLPPLTAEDIANEPTALANSQYREEATNDALFGQHLPESEEEQDITLVEEAPSEEINTIEENPLEDSDEKKKL